MLQDEEIDEIYSGFVKYPLYLSYLDKRKIQSCFMMFATLEIVDDKKNRHLNSNIQLEVHPIKINYGMDKLNEGHNFTLIAPKKLFTKMFKNFNLDLRELVKEGVIAEVDFIIKTRFIYEIKKFEIKK